MPEPNANKPVSDQEEKRLPEAMPVVVRFDLDDRTVTFRYATEADVREAVRPRPMSGAELAAKSGFEPVPDWKKDPFVRPMRIMVGGFAPNGQEPNNRGVDVPRPSEALLGATVEGRLVVTNLCDMRAFYKLRGGDQTGRLVRILEEAINLIEGRDCFDWQVSETARATGSSDAKAAEVGTPPSDRIDTESNTTPARGPEEAGTSPCSACNGSGQRVDFADGPNRPCFVACTACSRTGRVQRRERARPIEDAGASICGISRTFEPTTYRGPAMVVVLKAEDDALRKVAKAAEAAVRGYPSYPSWGALEHGLFDAIDAWKRTAKAKGEP